MDKSRWVRDPEKVKAVLVKQADHSVVATKPCKIYIPKRFVEKQLAVIAAETYIVGIFAIVVEDKYYSVSLTNAMLRIKPSMISTVKFDGDSYLEFSINPGGIVFATTQLIKSDVLVYKIFDEIIAKGHVPWYVGYDDLCMLFTSAKKHAGVNLGPSHAILEMFAASITRDSVDRSKYYRHTIETQDDATTRPPTVIPLRSVVLGATNTTSRLLGSYFDDGLTSALVNPSQRTEKIEELLRR